MTTLNLSQGGQEQTILEIDYIGQRYGLFRQENETVENFKRRILSLFVYESNTTDVGYSSAAARALGAYPAAIGYINITDSDYRIRFDGHKLVIYSDIAEEEIFFDTLDSISIGEIAEYLVDNAIGEIVFSQDKYKVKEIGFLFPFTNFENNRDIAIRPGLTDLFDRHIIGDSFKSKSEYFKTQKISADLVTSKGDYYFDGVNRLIVYDDGTKTQFGISYSKRWQHVPIIYCPVAIKGLPALAMGSQTNNYTDKMNVTLSDTGIFTEIDHDYLELFWKSLVVDNKVWKANQTSPVSVSGTYYGK